MIIAALILASGLVSCIFLAHGLAAGGMLAWVARRKYMRSKKAVAPLAPHHRKLYAESDMCTLERNIFRIIYHENGPHAPVRYSSGDNENVPARVEDVARQLEVAMHVLCTMAGFPSPLENPAFPGYSGISVYFFGRSMLGAFNGRSFTLPESCKDPNRPRDLSGFFYVANDLPANNLTPAHELFHQIQNSMTNFRNPWLFEGTARWAESLLAPRQLPRFTLPEAPDERTTPNLESCYAAAQALAEATVHTPAHTGLAQQRWWVPPVPPWRCTAELFENKGVRERIAAESYNAAFLLWFPLVDLFPLDVTPAPAHCPVYNTTYTDGTPIACASSLRGVAFMHALFQDLRHAEAQVRNHLGYTGQWTPPMRRHARNNPFLFESLRRTVQRL